MSSPTPEEQAIAILESCIEQIKTESGFEHIFLGIKHAGLARATYINSNTQDNFSLLGLLRSLEHAMLDAHNLSTTPLHSETLQ